MISSNQNNTVNRSGLNAPDHSIMSVFEHQRLTVGDFVLPSDFDWLLAQEFAVFTIKRQGGQWQLKVGHYIGIIILPSGMALEILPKPVAGTQKNNLSQPDEVQQTRQWVQRMLSELTQDNAADSSKSKLPHTHNFGQLSQHLAPLSTQNLPLSEWLMIQFLQLLANYHPVKHYQTQIRHQSSLQGKLLIKEQLRRQHIQPHKFVSEVSVLSPETLSNRLIKSALLLLEPLLSKTLPQWRQVTALSRHEVRNLDLLYVTAQQQLNVQPLTRQQLQSAQQLLNLSHWLLKAQQVRVHTGNSLSNQSLAANTVPQLRLCLLINMNQAFEQWASRRVAASFNQINEEQQLDKQNHYQTLYQPRDVWLRDSEGQVCLSVQPDLLIYHAIDNIDKSAVTQSSLNQPVASTRHCSHVIDIKWKHLAQSTAINASDAYQLTSYAQAYQAEQVWLVYPVTDSARQPIALRQPLYSGHAELWLMPFNVLTGSLNCLSTLA